MMDTILLLLQEKSVRQLLADWLSDDYDLLSAHEDQPFERLPDLCILDEPMLEQYEKAISARRASARPEFLNCLLVIPKKRLDGISSHLGKTIDDVLLCPIERLELQARVANLLRIRQQFRSIVKDSDPFSSMNAMSLDKGGKITQWPPAFERNPLPMWVYELETLRFLAVNDAAVAKYGYSRNEFLAMTIKNIRPAEEIPRLLENITGRRDDLQSSGPWIHQSKDGREFYVEILSHSFSHFGRPARLVTANDVTKYKKAQNEILRVSADLQQAQAFARMGSWSWDIKANRVEWSDEMYRIFGIDKDHFTGMLDDIVEQAVHPDDRARVNQVNQAVVEGNEHTPLEFRIIRPDGSECRAWAEAGKLIRDDAGNPVFLKGIVQDITQRKQFEIARRESERRYRSLFHNSPISLWEEDFSEVKNRLQTLRNSGVKNFEAYFSAHPETITEILSTVKVIDVNLATLDLYSARNKDELLGNLGRILVGEDAHKLIPELVNIAEGRLKFSWETMNRALDGRLIYASLNWSVMPGYEDTLERVMVAVVDMTDRKRAEAELVAYRDQLEGLVAQRTVELVAARDQAESASRAKSDFLAMMSHEIRTPLNGILGLTHLALQMNLDEKLHRYLKHIQIAGDVLLATINDILDFSKIEVGKMSLEMAPFNLDEVFQTLASAISYRAQEKGLELVFTISEDVPRWLVGDSLRLGQILINLLSNAVKFTEYGQVVVKVCILKGSARYAKLEFVVQDTGIGVSEELIEEMFKPFSQADISTSRKYGGSGLGLTISQRLVQLMGGEIHVESQVGQGAKFSFILTFKRLSEIVAHKSQAKKVASTAELSRMVGRRVLLVEDNEINQLVATEMLRNLGLFVSIAKNGEEALIMVEKGDYELVLMDIQMPGMDGYQTTARIRSDQRFVFEKLPIIAMTAHALAGEREKALQAGMNDYISKPVDAITLTKTLLGWFDAARRTAETGLSLEEQSSPVQAAACLNAEAALARLGGNQQLYQRLVSMFKKDLVKVTPDLRLALVNQDFDAAQRLAHTLKGVTATIGAEALSEAARHLESAILENQIGELEKRMAELELQVNLLAAALARI
jgi:PAS domain S-box-containing protein